MSMQHVPIDVKQLTIDCTKTPQSDRNLNSTKAAAVPADTYEDEKMSLEQLAEALATPHSHFIELPTFTEQRQQYVTRQCVACCQPRTTADNGYLAGIWNLECKNMNWASTLL